MTVITKKITELDALTTPDSSDVMPIVDNLMI